MCNHHRGSFVVSSMFGYKYHQEAKKQGKILRNHRWHKKGQKNSEIE